MGQRSLFENFNFLQILFQLKLNDSTGSPWALDPSAKCALSVRYSCGEKGTPKIRKSSCTVPLMSHFNFNCPIGVPLMSHLLI